MTRGRTRRTLYATAAVAALVVAFVAMLDIGPPRTIWVPHGVTGADVTAYRSPGGEALVVDVLPYSFNRFNRLSSNAAMATVETPRGPMQRLEQLLA